ncbi:hypothetical protein C9I57_01190 [Trinickia symbiotica]|uniref:FecR N-terminal domain-containing protein n=1 Tax=Trinickia symbiotica TaxID=863227 RepID=A0A2T3Y236_9BURK|nr:DUF4880 domain-containing protein [Trinickia symbiotica]PTB22844.1 hypothetical protein C9I57_01190 [Trinickia symbiotica]
MQAISEELRDDAVRWLILLRSEDASEIELEAFRRWLAQRAEHARAAYEVFWLWLLLGMLGWPDIDGVPLIH